MDDKPAERQASGRPCRLGARTSRHLRHLYGVILGLIVAISVLAAAFGTFVLIWGWGRFVSDFTPPDHSNIGPNLCASIFLVVMLIAHNEFVVEKRAVERHESHKQALEDGLEELLHPTEEAEADIADDVEAQFRLDLLDLLNPDTPGGIGTIAAKLDPIISNTKADP